MSATSQDTEREVVVNVDGDGTLEWVECDELKGLTAQGLLSRRRASHVEPDEFWQRQLFRLLRWAFGDGGQVAEWTRGWPVLWRVDMSPEGGGVLFGRWTERADALRAEREWLRKERGL